MPFGSPNCAPSSSAGVADNTVSSLPRTFRAMPPEPVSFTPSRLTWVASRSTRGLAYQVPALTRYSARKRPFTYPMSLSEWAAAKKPGKLTCRSVSYQPHQPDTAPASNSGPGLYLSTGPP